jgi:hypothetical protein
MTVRKQIALRERAELQRQGAKAAARGDSEQLNPLLDPINQPAATGEPAHEWALRRDAWQTGFDAQNRLRRRPPAR